jgi:hypothetical protein
MLVTLSSDNMSMSVKHQAKAPCPSIRADTESSIAYEARRKRVRD